MKKIVYILLLLSFSFFANAQYVKPVGQAPGDYRMHKGFHIEFGLGPVFGTITDNGTISGKTYVLEFSGTGLGLDIRIGGAIQDNLVLTFDMLSKSISGPKLTLNGYSVSAPNSYSVSEVTYGAGITYYFIPSDVFLSGTLGAGTYVSQDGSNGNNATTRTDYGFSYQLKVGKHWWISDKWGISLSGAYGSTSATDSGRDLIGTYTDDLSSTRFIIAASIGLH